MRDERQERLAPYTPLTSQVNRLTCHNLSKKVIFYQIHGGIETPDTLGLQGTRITKIPKKMQLIFYLNDEDCCRPKFSISNSTIQRIFIRIYNGQDVTDLLLDSVEGNDNSLLNKGFSELESINGIYMLNIDSNDVLIQLKNQNLN